EIIERHQLAARQLIEGHTLLRTGEHRAVDCAGRPVELHFDDGRANPRNPRAAAARGTKAFRRQARKVDEPETEAENRKTGRDHPAQDEEAADESGEQAAAETDRLRQSARRRLRISAQQKVGERRRNNSKENGHSQASFFRLVSFKSATAARSPPPLPPARAAPTPLVRRRRKPQRPSTARRDAAPPMRRKSRKRRPKAGRSRERRVPFRGPSPPGT